MGDEASRGERVRQGSEGGREQLPARCTHLLPAVPNAARPPCWAHLACWRRQRGWFRWRQRRACWLPQSQTQWQASSQAGGQQRGTSQRVRGSSALSAGTLCSQPAHHTVQQANTSPCRPRPPLVFPAWRAPHLLLRAAKQRAPAKGGRAAGAKQAGAGGGAKGGRAGSPKARGAGGAKAERGRRGGAKGRRARGAKGERAGGSKPKARRAAGAKRRRGGGAKGGGGGSAKAACREGRGQRAGGGGEPGGAQAQQQSSRGREAAAGSGAHQMQGCCWAHQRRARWWLQTQASWWRQRPECWWRRMRGLHGERRAD